MSYVIYNSLHLVEGTDYTFEDCGTRKFLRIDLPIGSRPKLGDNL